MNEHGQHHDHGHHGGPPPHHGGGPGHGHGHEEHRDVYIHIDHKKYDIHERELTGSKIRATAKPPIGSDYDLFLETKGPGDDRKIADHEVVKIHECESFYSVLRQINPGIEEAKKPSLLEHDEQFFKDKGIAYELAADGDNACVIIRSFPLFPGKFNRDTIDLCICIPKGYNDAKLDNFYVDPELTLKSGGRLPNTEVFENHAGRRWQRFSRHLPAWREGVDTLQTFMPAVFRKLQNKG